MSWKKMKQLGLVALCLGLCAFAFSCGGGGEKASPGPAGEVEEAPPAPETENQATFEEKVVEGATSAQPSSATGGALSSQLSSLLEGLPAADRERNNPLSGNADAIKAGRSEYMSMCFVCHGAEGKGDGPASKATPSVPSDLSDPARAGLLSDGDRFAVMRLGIEGTAMPASGANLNDEQIWRILAYVETLVKK